MDGATEFRDECFWLACSSLITPIGMFSGRYSKLKTALSWSNEDFLKYVKIKSLSAQPSDTMVVGVSAMGN